MDTLNALDASFLHIETPRNPMHVGSVIVFEGPAPAFEDVVALMESKLQHVPRYRQRVRFVPLRLARPVWVDDTHFNLSYHLRHTALPAPGGERELLNLASRVFSQMLDRNKPLWELWLVEGLEGGRWATINKTHHAMVDGVAGMDLTAMILDIAPNAVPEPPQEAWTPEPEPSHARFALRAAVSQPTELARALAAGIARPKRLVKSARRAARGLTAFAPLLRPHDTSLTGPIGPHRRFTVARASLEDVKAVRRAVGGTVNDVVLAAVTKGFRDLLEAHGEEVDGRTIRSMVPVSVRSEGEHGTYNNRVTALFADLPVGEADPLRRLTLVREQMEKFKASGRAVAADTLVGLAGFAPALLLDLAGRLTAHTPVATFDTVTTNIPGPQIPLYMLGHRMIEIFPFVPIAARIRTTVGIFSYNGGMTFGINSDYDSVPYVEVLATGIESGLRELRKAAEGAAAAERTPARKGRARRTN